MRSCHLVLLGLLLSSAAAKAEPGPDLYGYVTRVASPTDFEVDGLHVLLGPNTKLEAAAGKQLKPLTTPAPYIGQLARIWGHIDRSALTVAPERLVFVEARSYRVSGSAIIDLILDPTLTAYLLRADGRILSIDKTIFAKKAPTPSLPSSAPATPNASLPADSAQAATLQDLRTNVWIDYHGIRRSDGVVQVDQASFAENKVSKSEDKLRRKKDYDPASVPEDAHQSFGSLMFSGIDLKQLPPSKDAAMQERVETIGRKLVPKFQRDLPADDPTRINFRFEVADEPKHAPRWQEAITLPSGIIVIPTHVVVRLQDDSQIAAILANNIATALEKQTFRQKSAEHKLSAFDLAGAVAGAFVPGVGIAADLATGSVQDHIKNKAQAQSGRVALALMHDAGYDLSKAPEAWWILASKPGRDPREKSPPNRAANQLDELGTTWQPQPAVLP